MYSVVDKCGWVDHTRGDLLEQWDVSSLWEASGWIKPQEVDLADVKSRCSGGWLDHLPNLQHFEVAPEVKRLEAADLSYPIILHPAGWVMDGYHRIGKAFMQGDQKIWAVQFTEGSLPLPVIVIPNYLNRY